MATIKVTLQHGLQLRTSDGTETLTEVELREATAGDVIEASEESEKVVATPDGYQLVTSPTLLGLHVLRRQIVRIGDSQGPISMGELKRLHPADLNLLQLEAQKLEAATAVAASQEVTQRGRTDRTKKGA